MPMKISLSHRRGEKLVAYVFFGIVGILFSWLPVCKAIKTASIISSITFNKALKLEWQSWLLAIDEALEGMDHDG